jgi:hypothetical protein
MKVSNLDPAALASIAADIDASTLDDPCHAQRRDPRRRQRGRVPDRRRRLG